MVRHSTRRGVVPVIRINTPITIPTQLLHQAMQIITATTTKTTPRGARDARGTRGANGTRHADGGREHLTSTSTPPPSTLPVMPGQGLPHLTDDVPVDHARQHGSISHDTSKHHTLHE